MPEERIRVIADDADMIIRGYELWKTDSDKGFYGEKE